MTFNMPDTFKHSQETYKKLYTANLIAICQLGPNTALVSTT